MLVPVPAEKGSHNDLDQTLWKGILGDAGVDEISWSLEGKSQAHAHALYQQVLAPMADSDVLVAIAPKTIRNWWFRKFLDRIEAVVRPALDVHLILDNYATHKTPLIHR